MKKSSKKSKKLSRKDDFEVAAEAQSGTVGIDLEWKGIGLKISNEDGFTIGGGLGVAYIEYNTQGGGLISYLNGLYEIVVEKVDCSYVKTYYVGGQYTFSETQTIPECQRNDKVEEAEKRQKAEERDVESISEDGELEEIEFPPFLGKFFYLEVKISVSSKFTGDFGTRSCDDFPASRSYSATLFYWRRYSPKITTWFKSSQSGTLTFPYYFSTNYTKLYHCPKSPVGTSFSVQGWTTIRQDGSVGTVIPTRAGSAEGVFVPNPHWGGTKIGGKPTFPTPLYPTSINVSFAPDKIPLEKAWKKEDLNKPPMKNKCCFSKKDLKKLHQIHKALAVDEMLTKGMVISTSMYTPEGKGKRKLSNYLEINEYLIRILAHCGIFPFKWKLKDSNLAKIGNQELAGQTINGTDAIREILQSVKKGNSENEGLITAAGSLMIALEQIITSTTEGTRIIREIFQFLGVPVKSENFKLRLPFNTGALYKKITRKGKGRSTKNNQSAYELNTTEPSNTLLPKMLSQKEKEYELEVYDDNYPNLIEQLNNNQINNNGNN